MMPSVLAFLAAHWLAFFVLACMVVTTAIHQPLVRDRFPRLVAFVQGVLPADMPKVIAALVDRLPLMDREIAVIVEEVVERLLAARQEVAKVESERAIAALGTSGGAKMPPPGRG